MDKPKATNEDRSMIAEHDEVVKRFTGEDLIRQCWRGGTYAVLWRGETRQSYWISIDEWLAGKVQAPAQFKRGDLYYSLNPSAEIPPANKRGNTNRTYIAAQTRYLECVNVLFAEYDGKDMVADQEMRKYLPADYRDLDTKAQQEAKKAAKEAAFYVDTERYKARALALLQARADQLGLIPTVIVDSGGGYHCYWFLRDTVYLDEGNRDEVARTQHDFVAMMQGDQGASDLRRVLRVPGSYNHKRGFGDTKPQVTIIHHDPAMVYDYTEIEETVGDWAFAHDRRPPEATGNGSAAWAGQGMGEVRTLFNKSYDVVALLVSKGYTKCSADDNGFTRLARPGKEKVPSISVLPANEKYPQMAVHHSGNDNLHYEDTKRVDAEGKQHIGLDAWLIYVHLWHDGEWKTAYIAAKKALGLWVDNLDANDNDTATNEDEATVEVTA